MRTHALQESFLGARAKTIKLLLFQEVLSKLSKSLQDIIFGLRKKVRREARERSL
jgi:hypothetical protein